MKKPDATRSEQMMTEATGLIEAGEFTEALRIGRQLLERHYSGGFEIVARAQYESGQLEEAIATLREGIIKVPDIWILWFMLANYLSDRGEYSEAHQAYDRALACEESHADSIHLNRAVLLNRENRLGEALQSLDKVTDPGMQIQSCEVRIRCLIEMKKYDQAIALARHASNEAGNDQQHSSALSWIHYHLAQIAWLLDRNRNLAFEHARRAQDLNPAISEVFDLIRSIDGKRSPQNKYFRLIVEGRTPRTAELPDGVGFFRVFHVIAQNAGEALDFIRAWAPEGVQASLQIAESHELESQPGELSGVFSANAYRYYQDEN